MSERPEAIEVANALFERESSRIERLEDKLARHTDVLTALLPVTIALAAYSSSRLGETELLLTVAAGVYQALAYFASSKGSATFPFHTHDARELRQDVIAGTNLGLRVAARAALNAEKNVVRGIDLSNLITAAQRSIGISLVLLASAASVAVSNLDHEPTSAVAPRESETGTTPKPDFVPPALEGRQQSN